MNFSIKTNSNRRYTRIRKYFIFDILWFLKPLKGELNREGKASTPLSEHIDAKLSNQQQCCRCTYNHLIFARTFTFYLTCTWVTARHGMAWHSMAARAFCRHDLLVCWFIRSCVFSFIIGYQLHIKYPPHLACPAAHKQQQLNEMLNKKPTTTTAATKQAGAGVASYHTKQR